MKATEERGEATRGEEWMRERRRGKWRRRERVGATFEEKLLASFPRHVGIFSYDANGQITGLNKENGLITGKQLSLVNKVLVSICTIFDFDRTHDGNDEDRSTQIRIAELIQVEAEDQVD